jgi:signal transduction histidine kinase
MWGAFAVLNVFLMWTTPGSETIPFHFIYLSLAVVYGFRVWPVQRTVVLLVVVTVVTGAVLLTRYFQGQLALDECTEIILMPCIFAGQVWHAERHQRARSEVERMARYESQLLQSQREFLRDVSHAVRTPLTIARGYLDLICAGTVDQSVIDDAGVVLHQLDRLANMASQLLTLEQLEGPQALAAEPVDIGLFVEAFAARWSVSAPSRNWETSVSTRGVLVIADVERIELALDAIAENAVKFTEPGDSITVSCRTEGQSVTIEVSDSGIGLSADDTLVVFERFWKTVRSGSAPGNGLGLSVVRAIADAHGGSASAAPRVGGGAVFTLELPVAGAGIPATFALS